MLSGSTCQNLRPHTTGPKYRWTSKQCVIQLIFSNTCGMYRPPAHEHQVVAIYVSFCIADFVARFSKYKVLESNKRHLQDFEIHNRQQLWRFQSLAGSPSDQNRPKVGCHHWETKEQSLRLHYFGMRFLQQCTWLALGALCCMETQIYCKLTGFSNEGCLLRVTVSITQTKSRKCKQMLYANVYKVFLLNKATERICLRN